MAEKLQKYIDKLRNLEKKPERIRALALFSGGLDSILAAYLLAKQGVEVIGLHFDTGFLSGNHQEVVEKWRKDFPILKFEFIDISDEYIDLLNSPKYGYGAAANPFIDCHLYMIRQAAKLMETFDAHLIITGEVKGQRPKSQNSRAMELIKEQSEISGFLLRPLSAKLLPITVPEEKGWINRENLLAINGRSRASQLQLAKDFELNLDVRPGNDACFLLESPFSTRYFDFLLNNDQKPKKAHFELFKLGRQFRISPNAKLILGRNKEENEKLKLHNESLNDKYFMYAENVKGPIGLLEFVQKPSEEEFSAAASIILRYSNVTENQETIVKFQINDETTEVTATPSDDEFFRDMLLIGVSKNRKKGEHVPIATKNAKKHKGEINTSHG